MLAISAPESAILALWKEAAKHEPAIIIKHCPGRRGRPGNSGRRKLLGTVANLLGLDVKVSEVHGMSQRGGSVITYVRMADTVASPIIEIAQADFVLSFEELEALRWACLLKAGGAMLVNNLQIPPATVSTGVAKYPQEIVSELDQKALGHSKVFAFDAQKLADAAGSYRATNVVMLGAMSRLTAIDPDIFARPSISCFQKNFVLSTTRHSRVDLI